MSITPEVFHFGENVNHPGSILPGVSNPGFFTRKVSWMFWPRVFQPWKSFIKNDAKTQSEIALEAIENEKIDAARRYQVKTFKIK